MNIKESLSKIFDRYVVINLSAMLVVIILLCVGVGFGLDIYTHHGENIEVPNLKGMNCEKAERQLAELGLTVVVSDSGHNKKLPANSILLQTDFRKTIPTFNTITMVFVCGAGMATK